MDHFPEQIQQTITMDKCVIAVKIWGVPCVPSFPFPSLLTFHPSLPLPLHSLRSKPLKYWDVNPLHYCYPLNTAMGLGEHCKLPRLTKFRAF